MHEFELISAYFSGYDDDAIVGIGDDAAVLPCDALPLVVAVDTLVADVHFPSDAPAHALGHRALAVNLSDLAAMGAHPRWMTLALTLPAVDERWVQQFSEGLRSLAAAHHVSLVGGDTTQGPLTITIQLLGSAVDDPLQRNGAQPGDSIYVGGCLGDAAGGLSCWQDAISGEAADVLQQRFLYPQPQVELGRALCGIASAAIDVSDGLLADLAHIARASALNADVVTSAVPVSDALSKQFGGQRALQMALSGGDDYVLCFSSADAHLEQRIDGVHRIGEFSRGTGHVRVDGQPPEQTGYRHFG